VIFLNKNPYKFKAVHPHTSGYRFDFYLIFDYNGQIRISSSVGKTDVEISSTLIYKEQLSSRNLPEFFFWDFLCVEGTTENRNQTETFDPFFVDYHGHVKAIGNSKHT